jgi:hypothetical protein
MQGQTRWERELLDAQVMVGELVPTGSIETPSAACSLSPTPHHTQPDQHKQSLHQARPEQPQWKSWTDQRYPHALNQTP